MGSREVSPVKMSAAGFNNSNAASTDGVSIDDVSIAAIVPCHNEELAIAAVVRDLRAAVPGMVIYVYDNRSTDNTAAVATAAGAIVRKEDVKGKGNVVRRAFADIEADVYLLIDGDDTYDASAAPGMIKTLLSGPYDHILGVRKQTTDSAYQARSLDRQQIVQPAGDEGLRDTGQRHAERIPDLLPPLRQILPRRVQRVRDRNRTDGAFDEPAGAADRGRGRFQGPAGGQREQAQHLPRRFQDPVAVFQLIRHERPLAFHSILAAVVLLIAVILGIPLVIEFSNTGLVPRFPTAFLASSLVIIAVLILVVGFVLDGITRSRRESARLVYLGYHAPGAGPLVHGHGSLTQRSGDAGSGPDRHTDWVSGLAQQTQAVPVSSHLPQ